MASNNSQPPAGSSRDLSALLRGLNSPGLATGRGGARLPSLKGPRDLTLGGVAKRTFAPVIPVRKEKNKASANAFDTSQEGAGHGGRGRGRGRDDRGRGQRGRGRGQDERGRGRGGRGRGGRELIQSQGSIFSDGPGESLSHNRGSRSGSRDVSDSGFVPMPKLTLNHEARINKEEEDEKLRMLLRDDFIDDGDEDVIYDGQRPVLLPMKPRKLRVKKEATMEQDKGSKSKSATVPEKAISVKPEPMDYSEYDEVASGTEAAGNASQPEDKKDIKEEAAKASSSLPLTAAEFFAQLDPGRGELIFLQLPDSLPVISSKEEERVKVEPGLATPASTMKQGQEKAAGAELKTENNGLLGLSEGYKGKLQVLSSGEVRLLLGNVSLIVNMGTQVGFLQDLVSVHCNENNSGQMTVLGHVKHRLVCTPDMEALLQHS